MFEAFASHQLGQPVVVDLGYREGSHLAAVAEHGHTFSDLDDLVEPMADKDDADPLRLQASNRCQKKIDLVARERRGRLVHEQDASVGRQTPADGHDLALGDRQPANHSIEGQVGLETCKRRLRGKPHLLSWRRLQGRRQYQTYRDVFFHGQVRKKRQVLEDDLDAELPCLVRRQTRVGHPAHDDGAAWIGRMDAGQDLDERRLA